ncbi:class I SAM-dependent methyltransferase [Actinomyces viscosus]|uniref:O-Methyltransferase involved in polyketide biosynthesis n=1 Tax=Actinomyces viscosus TaxID=1656 RepID=A0A3S4YZL6_ACTVI|nr:class I SAM-dependent methyltransferase [Actinomyces viscosus]TFH53137.1 class I SAM-dependent methyltransferase [Actinomyces viscosus]VEI14257.1 O-Methyltransferase involved in polyketide biosynthesis [Actinomyces viscosus]
MSAYETADLNGVSKTMLLTLHARAQHTLSDRPRFTDPAAVELVSRIDYDFTMASQDRLMADGVVLRTLTLDPLVAGYLATHPGCTVVNIACGLDTRFQRLDDGLVTWYDLDLPDVIELRRRLLDDGERHHTIAASALDPDWPDRLGEDKAGGRTSGDVLVIIEGLSMYLEQDEVRSLLDIIAARLPGATVLIEVMARLFQKYGRERSVEDAGARYTYGCSSAAEFQRTVAPGFTLLHDVPFTDTIARYNPVLAPLVRLPLVGRLSERIVVLRAPA